MTSVASSSLTALVLAAGQGTRMKSHRPKVLHPLCGRPLLYYPLRAAFDAGASHAVIVTSGNRDIESEIALHFPREQLSFVVQEPARGTGDAARIGLERIQSEQVLIVYGDTPLLRAEDLARLVESVSDPEGFVLSLLSCELDEPRGYGRVLRNAAGQVLEVREDRDLRDAGERAVREVNAGVYAAKTEALRQVVARIRPDNAQREYYLTDAVRLVGEGRAAALLGDVDALLGVNDRAQLWEAEERMFARIRRRHALSGVTFVGDARVDDSVELGVDVVVEAGVRLRGKTRVGAGTLIDVGCVLDGVDVGEHAVIKPYSVMSASEVGSKAQIGPFSHLRPESRIEEGAHLGNFVETKKTRIRKGAKANHLAYLGDADVGENANVGAGVIFCNYDGYQKHRSVIGEGAFIGSDSQIVSPVTIGKGAYVGTGTTVTQDVPEDALAIGRAKQENKLGYAPKIRARFKAARDAKKT
ncbi:MAG TPA: bifunctional UDP-N-acetylglucosamine diphosphorylase/glucosamine-1-phosphate N-acetyltransferase GlmU [Polyangiaceae bacterium]|nr:bifunctional UDP-N-acetylglucosamine diphosphorylase/glucosamine-1-phosphate N-acetyltransferase GlmU [Polyangiaceae bacterium]